MIVEPREATDPEVLKLISASADEMRLRYAGTDAQPFPLGESIRYVVAVDHGDVLGCGALQALEPGIGEVKRIYVRPEHRGRGVARLILAALEARARTAGWHTVRLETGHLQPEAIALYESAGYAPIPAYGHYIGNQYSLCFSRSLA